MNWFIEPLSSIVENINLTRSFFFRLQYLQEWEISISKSYSFRYRAWIPTVLSVLITHGSCVGSLLAAFYNPGAHLEPWKIIFQIMFFLLSAIGVVANGIVYKYSYDIYVVWNRITRLFHQI